MVSGAADPVNERASRRIVRNAMSILLGDAAGEVLIGYSIVLTALSLGPNRFGTLSEAQAFMEPFDAVAALGFGNVAMTVAASRGDCDGALRGTILGIRTLSAAVAGALGISMAFATGRGTLWPLLLVYAMGMFAVPVTMTSTLPFQWHRTIHRRIALPFLIGVCRLGSIYLAFLFLRRPLGFQLALLVAAILAAGLNFFWTTRVYPDALRFDRALAKELLSTGWPAAVLECVVMLYSRASYFFLHDVGAHAQGEYAAADRLMKPVMAIGGALFVSSLPTIADLAIKRQFVMLKKSYVRAVAGVALGLVPLLLLVWFLAAWLLERFAPAYAAAIWPFRVLAVGAFFMFLNMLSTTYIVALGKFRLIMTIVLADLVVYLFLATHLIPKYGALGAAFSTSVMESANTMMQLTVVLYLLSKLAREEDVGIGAT